MLNSKYVDNIELLYMLFNIIKMLEDRGYNYLNTNYDFIKKEYFLINKNTKNNISDYTYLIKNKHTICFKKNKGYIIVLFIEAFSDNYVININHDCKKIINFISSIAETKGQEFWNSIIKFIIICPNEIEIKVSKRLYEEVSIIETIQYSKLIYNLTEHVDFVKHEKIKNFEKKYKKYNLKLPILLKTDPVSKWYEYNINDIIKISRNNNNITHRIVKTGD